MTPLARSWLRRIALGLPFVIMPLASCGDCPDVVGSRVYPIDDAQLARVVDGNGNPTLSGCNDVCSLFAGHTDAGPGDAGIADAGQPRAPDSFVRSCTVATSGATHQLTCNFGSGCPGGRRPATLVGAGAPAASAGEWLARMAWMEAASVEAFETLALELTAWGAPPELVRDARVAATDERRHAAQISGLARARGVEPAVPRYLPPAARSLEALAIDNALEGGIRETFGALLAAHQASTARDADVREVMREIAVDEARHALLSARIDGWARSRIDGRILDDAHRAAAAELGAMLEQECDEATSLALGLPPIEAQRTVLMSLA